MEYRQAGCLGRFVETAVESEEREIVMSTVKAQGRGQVNCIVAAKAVPVRELASVVGKWDRHRSANDRSPPGVQGMNDPSMLVRIEKLFPSFSGKRRTSLRICDGGSACFGRSEHRFYGDVASSFLEEQLHQRARVEVKDHGLSPVFQNCVGHRAAIVKAWRVLQW